MKVSLKDDSMPDGTELHVRGLGMLVNGKTVEFTKEEIERFESDSGKKLSEAFKNDDRISLSGSGSKGGEDS